MTVRMQKVLRPSRTGPTAGIRSAVPYKSDSSRHADLRHPEAEESTVAKAQELAGGRVVEVAAGDVGGQVLAAGLIDEVRMDVVPVVFGSGKHYFGSVHAQHLLEDPDVVLQGNRVLHLRYRLRR